jgi:hypothetical protein
MASSLPDIRKIQSYLSEVRYTIRYCDEAVCDSIKKTVKCPRQKTPTDVAVCMHEIGHAVTNGNLDKVRQLWVDREYEPRTPGDVRITTQLYFTVLLDELTSWSWALAKWREQTGHNPPEEVCESVVGALWTYFHRVALKIVLEDHTYGFDIGDGKTRLIVKPHATLHWRKAMKFSGCDKVVKYLAGFMPREPARLLKKFTQHPEEWYQLTIDKLNIGKWAVRIADNPRYK